MKATPLTLDEVDDFWALNVPVEADFVPEAVLVRALRDRRVQRGVSTSSMGTAETYWSALEMTDLADARADSVVVPPGQQAEDTPYEEWADDRDSEKLLWRPFRRDQRLRLAGAMPEPNARTAMMECLRIHAALDERHRKLPRALPAPYFSLALDEVMARLDELPTAAIDKRVLRFEIVRTLVKIAWNRPWQPVDVAAAWWD